MGSYKKKNVIRKKSKSSKKKSKSRNSSNTKVTWEKFLKNNDSRKALEKSWSSKNPQKYYKSTIAKLTKKYSNKK